MAELFAALTWSFEFVPEIPNHSGDLGLRPPSVGYFACDHLIQYDAKTEHITRHGVGFVPEDLRGTPIELLLIQFLVILCLMVLLELCIPVGGLRRVS